MYSSELLRDNSKDIISRMMAAYGVNTAKELGEKFQKSKQAVQNASSKSVPSAWLLQAASDTGMSVDWFLFEGENPPSEVTQENVTSDDFKISSMLEATTRVLESDTVYRTALASNIRAFDKAVQQENDVEGLKEQMTLMLEKMDSMQEQLNRRDCTRKKRDPETKSQVNSDE